MRRQARRLRPAGGGIVLSRACAACGTPARPPFQAPPPELAPDLDLRPGEPTRSTLPRWLQTCRTCGVSAPDLARLPPHAAATAATPAYQALRGPAPQNPFLRHAHLLEAAGETDEAAATVLQAAWILDDAGQDAAPLRRRAAALWQHGATMQDGLRIVDVLRRAGDMPAAAAQVARLLVRTPLAETDQTILAYQQALIQAQDTARHLMSSALRPPAYRPHFTHGRSAAQPRPRTLWQRLAGR